MLLYHFPLIDNYNNRGFSEGEINLMRDVATLATGNGKISNSSLYFNQNDGLRIAPTLTDDYTVAFRFMYPTQNNLAYADIFRFAHFLRIEVNEINGLNLYNSYNFKTIKLTSSDLRNTWHDYIISVHTNNLVEICLDKQLLYSNTVTFSVDYLKRPLLFGKRNFDTTLTGAIKGYLQDVRIYNYTLSQAEINEYSRALVVHYPLQGNVLNSNVIKDCSGFGNDLVYPDSTYIDDFVSSSARYNKMLSIKSKQMGQISASSSIVKGKTISVWIKQLQSKVLVSTFDYMYLYKIKNTLSGTIVDGMYVGDGNNRMLIYSSNNAFGYPTTVGETLLLTIVFDGTQRLVYINGELNQTKEVALSDFLVYGIFDGYGGVNNLLDGAKALSDYRVYATALSAEDIKNLYNSPISLDNKHNTTAFEFKENTLYPSKYWRTPTYAEMKYILNTRTNATNLRTLGRVEISSGTYRNGLFLLPDGFTAPSGITVTITTADYTTNSYSLSEFEILENAGAIFLPVTGWRTDISVFGLSQGQYFLTSYRLYFENLLDIRSNPDKYVGRATRLCKTGSQFSVSATNKIDFAPANLQYHCTQHIWRFAQHSYDIIGADNANISDSYNGWIDLFGYGTSGINYSPTLHTTNNSDYASGDISNTDNDWGVNEIQSYDYNVKNFALNKNGIVQHNELSEYDLLPEEYQLVEYLESTGEQWIDTEYYPNMVDSIEVTYALTDLSENQGYGCLGTNPTRRCHTRTVGVVNAIFYSSSKFISYPSDTNYHTYKWDLQNVSIDGIYSHINENVYPAYEFYLFARNFEGTVSDLCASRCKVFKVNGKVGMYPCYRKSDNKPGMYDIIRHKFFTNKGTGDDFLVGNDVPKINGIYKYKILTNKLIEN